MSKLTHPFIHTHSGKQWVVDDLKPDMIDIESIAHGLAKECRFGGQINSFYSVARHCLNMRHAMQRVLPRHEWVYALLHDAAEAYLGDIPKPIKVTLPDYNRLEGKVMSVISQAFQLDSRKFDSTAIKDYDSRIVLDEATQLFSHTPKWVNDFYAWQIYPIGIQIETYDWKTDLNDFIVAFHEDIAEHDNYKIKYHNPRRL